ncbi:MAG: hypothetical protein FJZ00_09920, partial [Candidatus Sericytochromatia bacterium]|nr:hypothetical protein [Candidatus Tanganyikabacteria bacterium]
RARAAIASASLGVDLGNLVVGRQRQLAGDYATALAGDRNALAAWESFLGRPIRPLVTVAGIFGYGLNTAGPAPAAAAPTFGAAAVAISGTSILIADRHSHQIAEVTADGQLRPLTAVSKTDPTVAPAPPVPETGTPAITALIPSPIAVAADRQGNVFVTMSSAVDAPRNVVLMICAEPSPKFGFGRMQAGAIYRVAGGVDARSGLAGFDGPAGLAVDDAGDLYVADRRNDRIVRVSRETGIFEVVAARAPGARMSSDGDLPADGASLFMPAALAWRKTATGEELFVLDAFYQRVRAVRKAGATWAGARVITVAGSGAPVPSAGAPVVPGDFAGDGGPALSARLHLAQVDTLDWRGSELPIGGLAVDGGRSVLYVADARNGRVRAIDLATGRIATVAGGGRSARDGIALDCRLSHPVGLAVAPGGDVIVADQGAHAVRRIVTAH